MGALVDRNQNHGCPERMPNRDGSSPANCHRPWVNPRVANRPGRMDIPVPLKWDKTGSSLCVLDVTECGFGRTGRTHRLSP